MPKIEGYYYPPICGQRLDQQRVGLAIYVKIGIVFKEISSPLDTTAPCTSICAISVKGLLKDLKMCNIYTPIVDREGLWASQFTKSGWLVTGDFNVHSSPEIDTS